MASAPAGTLYRGGEGMWSWVAHRITGVAVFFFLLVHVMDTALVRVSPSAYDVVIATYKTPIVNVMEVGLVGAVLYHALNGIRIVLVDFWEPGPRHQKAMFRGIIVIWLLLMIPGTYFMLIHTIESLFGSTS
ncbi:MAG: succinate dehydrogenase, cytochrome b556 subunit [Candidatus Nanopelagicales bacterium]|jgi:succinate dehydrogenase / fumarate reductase cytochrome b subunit|nr:succinate dehydrogenase, cytochrome b556 subunit [Candidatus Nanopelagicales bacterium]